MPRKPNLLKRLAAVIRDYMLDRVGEKDLVRNSRSGYIDRGKYEKITQQNSIKVERATRDRNEFIFVCDVEANMPLAAQAMTQMSEDAALDENGDDRAWAITVMVEPLSESDADRKAARELRKTLQSIGDDYAERTEIGYNTKHYLRKMLSTGNCFADQWISLDTETGLGAVEYIKELPTWQMHVIQDDFGDLAGYEQHTELNDKFPVRWTIPQQVIHWKFKHSQYKKYGEQCFSHLKGKWEQFKLVELDYLMAIHTRAVNPVVYKLGIEGSGEKVDEKEIQAFRKALRDNPVGIDRDFVVDRGYVELEFPDGGDAQAIKVLAESHAALQAEFIEAIGAQPPRGKDTVARRDAASLDQKYARRISSLRGDFTFFLKPSVRLEFALKGYNFHTPEKYGVKKIDFDITWPDLGETRLQKTKRGLMEWGAGAIPLAMFHQQVGYQDSEGLIEQMQAERSQGVLPLAELFAQRTLGASGADVSNNGDEGPGVGTRDNGDENETQVRASAIHSLLARLGMDEQEIRQIVRDELKAMIDAD